VNRTSGKAPPRSVLEAWAVSHHRELAADLPDAVRPLLDAAVRSISPATPYRSVIALLEA